MSIFHKRSGSLRDYTTRFLFLFFVFFGGGGGAEVEVEVSPVVIVHFTTVTIVTCPAPSTQKAPVRSNQVRVFQSHDVKNAINSHFAIARVDQAKDQADGYDRSKMTTTVDRRW